MSAVTQSPPATRLIDFLVEEGARVILIDPMSEDDRHAGVEVVSTLEHTVDALIDLHTEPIIDRVTVVVQNAEVFVNTPAQTLLSGLALYARRRGILLIFNTGIG